MRSHVLKERAAFGKDEECTILEITGSVKGYWMMAEASADAKLADLDVFLRSAWMECCGHCSRFHPKGASPWGRNEYPVSLKISEFPEGFAFSYIYDFGSTSGAEIKVLGASARERCKGAVRLLARNDPIPPRCGVCGEDADHVGHEGVLDEIEHPALCSRCLESIRDEDNYVPFTNSPRMGICGYCGELDVFDYAPNKPLPESEKISLAKYKEYYSCDDY